MSKLFIASDHAGFALKGALVEHIQTLGYDIEDIGAFSFNPEDDYPDFVTPLARLRAALSSAAAGREKRCARIVYPVSARLSSAAK